MQVDLPCDVSWKSADQNWLEELVLKLRGLTEVLCCKVVAFLKKIGSDPGLVLPLTVI